jgi:hypothetical protein
MNMLRKHSDPSGSRDLATRDSVAEDPESRVRKSKWVNGPNLLPVLPVHTCRSPTQLATWTFAHPDQQLTTYSSYSER